jgi:hypothetical protein
MIGYGKSQNAVYEFLKERKRSATSKEVGLHFGKTSKWAYKILASLEDAFRICASNGGKPITWWVKDEL